MSKAAIKICQNCHYAIDFGSLTSKCKACTKQLCCKCQKQNDGYCNVHYIKHQEDLQKLATWQNQGGAQ